MNKRIILLILIIFIIILVLFTEKTKDSYINQFKKKTQKIKNPNISIGWVGDIVPTDNIDYNNSVFKDVQNYLEIPDLMIGNLEGGFADKNRISKCSYLKSHCYAFSGSPFFAQNLKVAGFDVVNLANNHAYDYGDEGLADTEKILKENNINFVSPTKPTLEIVVKNKKIGLLGITSSGDNYSTLNDYDFISDQISKLKQRNDLVILLFHGGSEGSDKTLVENKYEFFGTENRGNVYLMARVAIDAGADIVLGSGPHVLRKIEYYNNKLIIYSAGNFAGGGKLITKDILGISAIFNIEVEKTKILYNIVPIQLNILGIPSFDPSQKALTLIDSLK